MTHLEKVGKLIREFRKEVDLTQEQMAKEIGVKRSSYSLKENGKRKVTLKEAVEISKVISNRLHEPFYDIYKCIFLDPDVYNLKTKNQKPA